MSYKINTNYQTILKPNNTVVNMGLSFGVVNTQLGGILK